VHPGGRCEIRRKSGRLLTEGLQVFGSGPRRSARGRPKAVFLLLACCTQEEDGAPKGATVIKLSGGVTLQFRQSQVQFGHDPRIEPDTPLIPECRKNIEMEPCTLDFVKSIAIGKPITSAGDFGSYLELGLDHRFNLGLHEQGFHLISTQNPIQEHRL
jgi:hypothetical protein